MIIPETLPEILAVFGVAGVFGIVAVVLKMCGVS